MAQVSFAPDKTTPPMDEPLEQAAAVALLAGKPIIKLRLQPDLYNFDKRHYSSWAGLTWMLDLESVEEGRRFREGLEWFLKAFGDPEKQKKVLELLEGL